jgi:O-antigen/teichoic acid export membrane protein
MNLLKRYRESIVFNRFIKLFSVDVLIKASSFILLPVYLKLMTQSEFGLFNYLISIVVFFSQILNFGLFIAQSKIYHELDEAQKAPFIFTIQMTLLILLVPSILIIYLFHFDYFVITLLFKTPIDYDAFRFPILLAVIASVYSFMLYNYFLTAEKIKHVQRYNIIRLVLLNVVVLLALYFFKNKVNARLITTYIIELVLVICFFYYLIIEMKPQFNKSQMYRSIKIGFPVMSVAICGVVINFGDKFLLEKHGGFVDLSIYYLAFSIASFIPLLFNTFQNIWLPIFLKEKDLKKNLALTKKMFFTLAGVYIILSVFVIILIKFALLYSFIDLKYNKVLLILPIILISLIIDSLTHLCINYVTFFEQTYILPIFSTFVGVVSIISNVFFIKFYGLYGAACSSLIINILGFLMFYFLLKYNLYKINLAKLLIN